MGMGMHYTDCSDSEIARQSTSSSAEGSEEVDQFPKATSPGMGPHHVLEGSLSSHSYYGQLSFSNLFSGRR